MTMPELYRFDPAGCICIPRTTFDRPRLSAFGHLWSTAMLHGNDRSMDYDCHYPKYEFLNYLTQFEDVALHGSSNPDISTFEPRDPGPSGTEFHSQKAVYATGNSILSLYYAVTDRVKWNYGTRINGVFPVTQGAIQWVCFFSWPTAVLEGYPWTAGMIYILPKTTFFSEEEGGHPEGVSYVSHASVPPLAKLPVVPADFPFLDDVWGHDEDEVRRRFGAPDKWQMYHGYPAAWDTRMYPVRPTRPTTQRWPHCGEQGHFLKTEGEI